MNRSAAFENGRRQRTPQNSSYWIRYFRRYWFIYLLALPGVLHVLIFSYVPMAGIVIAFKKYKFLQGVWASPWVGFDNFQVLFRSAYFLKVIRNTVLINIYGIVVNTVFVIVLALFINEIKSRVSKSLIQTAVYLPHFISWVVFAGLINVMLSPNDGMLNKLIMWLGGQPVYFLGSASYFRSVLVVTGLIKGAGYSTIIYLAAISGINPELYECSLLDGANRFQQMWYITIPRIKPTIIVLLILSLASLFGSNFEQVFNLYSPLVYETGDVISTYLYRTGMQEGKFEIGTAMGLVFSVFSILAIFVTNIFVKKMDVMGIL